ncbi:hypothetical protein [Variovorax sp. ZT4R33]|uniref:hypothetical protein n=1 Tax=Variovorax sp. ZT4R33 TaxID=3443743 RepID=UPI003F462B5A
MAKSSSRRILVLLSGYCKLRQLGEKGLVRFKPGVTLQGLQTQARAQTDLAAALAMQQAKADLFALLNKPRAPLQA